MHAITASIVIHRPPAEVFSQLTDLTHWPKWQSGLVRAEKISVVRPLRAGSQVRLIRKGNRPASALMEVTHMMPHELFGIKSAGRSRAWERNFTLQPVRGGTRLRLKHELRDPQGFLGDLATRWKLAQELQSFKSLVESG
jgi:hypothetical protein